MSNVRELWAMRDTVLIGTGMSALARGWFESFAQMAAANEVPFLTSGTDHLLGHSTTTKTVQRCCRIPIKFFRWELNF